MTYKELLDFLQALESTDSRLSDKVTIFDADNNELRDTVELMKTVDNKFYFAFE